MHWEQLGLHVFTVKHWSSRDAQTSHGSAMRVQPHQDYTAMNATNHHHTLLALFIAHSCMRACAWQYDCDNMFAILFVLLTCMRLRIPGRK